MKLRSRFLKNLFQSFSDNLRYGGVSVNKKYLALTLSAIIVSMMLGCHKKEAPPPPPPPPPPVVEKKAFAGRTRVVPAATLDHFGCDFTHLHNAAQTQDIPRNLNLIVRKP